MKRVSTLFAAFVIVALAASAPAVVINEFLYSSEGGNSFIELYNRTNRGIEISGWHVYAGDQDAGWGASPLFVVDDMTTIPAKGFYLVASQDVFVTVPDQEENFAIPAGDATIRGLALFDGDLGGGASKMDTVLYATAGADTGGTAIKDDANVVGPAYIVEVDAVPIAAGSVDMAADGSAARRRNDDATPTDFDEGNGFDSNNAQADFIGVETGHASPRAMNTPVTLTVFEAK